MKKTYKILLLIVFLTLTSVINSQTSIDGESEIVNLIITFQQKRHTKSAEAKTAIEKAIGIAKKTGNDEKLVSCKILKPSFFSKKAWSTWFLGFGLNG